MNRLAVAIVLFVAWAGRCDEPWPASVQGLVAHVSTNRDGRVAWSIDFSALEGDRSGLPIGVFDSGIGGLTVLEAILQLDAFNNETLRPGADGRPDFADERFIYFGDQANMPYGNYPSQGREAFLRELIIKDAIFLLGRRWRAAPEQEPRYNKQPVKAIVIACNTATAYGLEDIRAALKQWKINIPVIGIIEAAARDVAERDNAGTVAVLATVGTCSSQAYPKAIGGAAGRAGKSAPVVVQQGSIGLAGAIEGKSDGRFGTVADYARYDVLTLLDACRGQAKGIETIVLGCTHFPLARTEIAQAFEGARNQERYANSMAKELRFIDPSESVARELFIELARTRIRNKAARTNANAFFFSVPNPKAGLEPAVIVPLTVQSLPASSAPLAQRLPAVWKELNR